jgi:hypothetical protein
MVSNIKMQNLINQVSQVENSLYSKVNIENFKNICFPNFKRVYDCVVISDKETVELEASFDKAIKINQDKTGYEANKSETCISHLMNLSDNSLSELLHMALLIVPIWKVQISSLFMERQICFVITCNEDEVIMRYHLIREEEPNWLANDLEKYKEPVGYIVF